MEMTGKQPHTPTGNNRTLRNINRRRFAEKTVNYTVSPRLTFLVLIDLTISHRREGNSMLKRWNRP